MVLKPSECFEEKVNTNKSPAATLSIELLNNREHKRLWQRLLDTCCIKGKNACDNEFFFVDLKNKGRTKTPAATLITDVLFANIRFQTKHVMCLIGRGQVATVYLRGLGSPGRKTAKTEALI